MVSKSQTLCTKLASAQRTVEPRTNCSDFPAHNNLLGETNNGNCQLPSIIYIMFRVNLKSLSLRKEIKFEIDTELSKAESFVIEGLARKLLS